MKNATIIILSLIFSTTLFGQSNKIIPFQGKGKPTEEDVILMVMENAHTIIPNNERGCPSYMGIKDRSVGRFLSHFWQKHSVYDTAHHNFLGIHISEGKDPKIKELHWEIDFTILWAVGPVDFCSVGLGFIVMDKDWKVLKESFDCYEDCLQ